MNRRLISTALLAGLCVGLYGCHRGQATDTTKGNDSSSTATNANQSKDDSGQKINIVLPDKVQTIYVVPATAPPKDLGKLTIEALNRHTKSLAHDIALSVLKSKLLLVESRDKAKCPPIPLDTLQATGSTPDELSKLSNAKQYIVVRGVSPARYPQYGDIGARTTAVALALDTKSVVVDLVVPETLDAEKAVTHLPTDKTPMRFADWVTVIASESDNGIWLTTSGLCRFGLPELQAVDVPPMVSEKISVLMTGLAWKIVQMFSKEVPIKSDAQSYALPSNVLVTANDVAEPYGKQDATSTKQTTVHLKLEKIAGDHEFLTLTPPKSFQRSYGEYAASLCKELFGIDNDKMVQAALSPEMQEAMDTARKTLPDLRTRFLNGKLPASAKVLVKIPLHKDGKTEYLWASLTSWSSPDNVAGFWANDAALDPNIRVGKEMSVKASSIVDWIIMVNDKIVEGGWTNKVLGE